MDAPDLSDETIVSHVTAGDIDEYAKIISRYNEKLHRYVLYMIKDDQAAADIVQDTFIKAYRNLKSFNISQRFSPWIYRIAHNETMNALRKDRQLSDADIDEVPYANDDVPLAELVDAKLLKKDIQQCLSKLAPKYREAIQLHYMEHMSYDQVSDVLHIAPSTVGVWLMRAKKQLRSICEKQGVTR